MTDRDVRVVKTKYDGSLHWHHVMRFLGEDEHGIWLGALAGSTSQRGDEPPIVMNHPYVQLIREGAWWSATFRGDPATTEIYCDVGTPPQWPHPAEVTMVDLDLDVLRIRADQRVIVVDEDEFAVHQVRYGYPADVIGAAERAAAWLLDAISAEAEPFGAAYRGWLDMVE